jgi:hypothetical protein
VFYSFLESVFYSFLESVFYSFLESVFYSFLESVFYSFLESVFYSFLESVFYISQAAQSQAGHNVDSMPGTESARCLALVLTLEHWSSLSSSRLSTQCWAA